MKTFTLKNNNNLETEIIALGAIIKSIKIPTKDGMKDVLLGFDSADEYFENEPYFGATIGRFAGRIGNAKFSIDENEYRLYANNGTASLHGGREGFDKKIWEKDVSYPANNKSVKLSYFSRDGEEGFPGNLSVSVVYSLTDENELTIDYSATTDRKTHVNLTNHAYFNLSGNAKKDILEHKIKINANRFLEIDENLIPTGKLIDALNSPMDFTEFQKIGERIDEDFMQLNLANGYDHTFVLNDAESSLRLAAEVVCEESGVSLQAFTTEPGMVFYAGNFLDGKINGKNGARYKKRSGFCLEMQHFPDAPNKPSFPSTILTPREMYHQKTVFKFTF